MKSLIYADETYKIIGACFEVYNLNFARRAHKIHPKGRSRPRVYEAESGLTPAHPD